MTQCPDRVRSMQALLRSGMAAMAMITLALALAACRKPQPPDPERPPEPQAGSADAIAPTPTLATTGTPAVADSAPRIPRGAQDRDADVQTPLERVRDVETKVGSAADATRARIDPP
ncbi:hypothetical protein [Lysobacter sp. A3-1-A15]|uniref:hypothetical protein n=1 Tax=Novilysobacter viscosus TaxID=3098602 RepID=UPI002ED850B2